MTARKGRIGSRFADLLKEEGTYDETTAQAVKRVLAWQLDPCPKGGRCGE